MKKKLFCVLLVLIAAAVACLFIWSSILAQQLLRLWIHPLSKS